MVVHNTASPTLVQWHKTPGEQRMRNLEAFYRDQQHWSAGPHLFVADDLIWAFTPLTTTGVHSPSWNGVAWGIEMVGDYDTEEFTSGPGDTVRTNAISAIAMLHASAGLDPETMRLHLEDKKTTHKCPGSKVIKADLIAAVVEELHRRESGDHPLDKNELGG